MSNRLTNGAGHAETYLAIATIRRFEERILALKAEGLIQGSLHLCCGQEAIAVGACRALEERDALTATYRGHGWSIARGLPLAHMFAELLGRESPLCGGRAGSAFISSPEHGFLGENSIVGAGLPIAAGAALAARFDGSGAVSLVSIGEGTLNQGAAHEALNFAAVLSLPLVIVCENNLYSELTRIETMIRVETLAERAAAYGMPGVRIDGNDADEVERTVRDGVARARAGGGPTLIEAMTERLVGHYDLDPQHYRPAGEVEAASEREPLTRLRAKLGDEEADGLEREAVRLLDEALAEAEAFPFPDPETVGEHVLG
jgi:TPP-dependent pyruvate/acetoin dehydrogenase alpha subunit